MIRLMGSKPRLHTHTLIHLSKSDIEYKLKLICNGCGPGMEHDPVYRVLDDLENGVLYGMDWELHDAMECTKCVDGKQDKFYYDEDVRAEYKIVENHREVTLDDLLWG